MGRSLMSDFRIQRFTNPDDMQWADRGEEPPVTGWVFVEPGDVYLDGVHVGHHACYRMGQLDDLTPFWQIEYRAVEYPRPTAFSTWRRVEHSDSPGVCQDCGATNVQHRSLLRVTDGRSELLLLCNDCHAMRHGL
jgi:hypothetical protein